MLPYHPSEPEHFRLRNALLQKCLRPDPLPFAIEQEYPIVLAPEASEYSYCQDHEEQLSSHANLWPRSVVDPRGTELFRIGLVGNVATDPALRGLGLMRNLLNALEEEAVRQGLAALVLWSDLSSFYHRLGFASVGSEFRLHMHLGPPSGEDVMRLVEPSAMDEALLGELLKLRPPTPLTVGRNQTEFRALLTIPWLDTYVAYRNRSPVAYALLGKGYDMMGVVHEWGGIDPGAMRNLLRFVGRHSQLPQLMLLGPARLDPAWRSILLEETEAAEEVPMALIKVLDPKKKEELEELFIWGLDSI